MKRPTSPSGKSLRLPFERNAWLGLLLFGAALFTIEGLWPAYRSREARNWIETPCTIEISDLFDGADSWHYRIRYAYVFGGATYKSERANFYSLSEFMDRDLLKRFPTGSNRVCYVNPVDPHDAVIDRSHTFATYPVGLSVFVMLFGGALFVRNQIEARRTAE